MNDNNTIIPAEVVSRICFDYSQSILRFIGDEMAKCERKLDSDDVTKARFVALRNCLDYVEKSRWIKSYIIENINTIEVKELRGGMDDKS